jgi:hypothetical protein
MMLAVESAVLAVVAVRRVGALFLVVIGGEARETAFDILILLRVVTVARTTVLKAPLVVLLEVVLVVVVVRVRSELFMILLQVVVTVVLGTVLELVLLVTVVVVVLATGTALLTVASERTRAAERRRGRR